MSCIARVVGVSRVQACSSATRRLGGLAFGALIATAACQPNATVDAGTSCASDADCADGSVDRSVAVDVSAPNDAVENGVIVAAPSIDNFTPTTQGAGGEVTITGSNLENPAHVTFGGGPDARVTANSATSITAIVPVGSASGSVAVTTGGGMSSRPGFIYSNVISCAGFTRTIVETFPWVADSGINPTGNVGTGLMRGMAYVGIINVPAAAPSSPTSSGRISVAEYFDARTGDSRRSRRRRVPGGHPATARRNM